ncbi:MAG: SAM-dependent methyltransferase [Clostridia bacterium]
MARGIVGGGPPIETGHAQLDMGCGRAVSSIFLAREFDVQVFAVDLWIAASDNWQRVKEAGLDGQVIPIHADAHSLPFAEGFFDAAVSLDAYHYFGTDDLYTSYFARFRRPGGQVGIVSPGLRQEFGEAGVPVHLRPYWEPEFHSFHSPAWWRTHFEQSGTFRVERADLVAGGADHWLTWLDVCVRAGYPAPPEEAEMLRADAGRVLGFTRLVGRRRDPAR